MIKIPQSSFYFKVFIDGNQLSFQEVSGLEAEIEVEEITEGGENAFKHRLPKAVKYNNLVLKRGYISRDNSLVNWFNSSLTDAFEGTVKRKKILVELLDERGNKAMAWNVVNAYPVKWSMSNLNSQNSEFAIESLEFAYQSFTFE